MDFVINGSINVLHIEKSRLIKGKKGLYLNFTAFVKDNLNQYDQDVSITQSITFEERQKGTPTIYLGNGKSNRHAKGEINDTKSNFPDTTASDGTQLGW